MATDSVILGRLMIAFIVGGYIPATYFFYKGGKSYAKGLK